MRLPFISRTKHRKITDELRGRLSDVWMNKKALENEVRGLRAKLNKTEASLDGAREARDQADRYREAAEQRANLAERKLTMIRNALETP